jgi:hypothetical protein
MAEDQRGSRCIGRMQVGDRLTVRGVDFELLQELIARYAGSWSGRPKRRKTSGVMSPGASPKRR